MYAKFYLWPAFHCFCHPNWSHLNDDFSVVHIWTNFIEVYFLIHLNLSCSAFTLADSQGIIEDVVLLGAPVEGEAKHWKSLTRVVSGRIINGFCRSVCAQCPALVAWKWFGVFIPFKHFVSAGEDIDPAVPEPPLSRPLPQIYWRWQLQEAPGGSLTLLLALCATGSPRRSCS